MTAAAPGPGCVIVLAHPDDEALWTSSLLSRAARVVICFGAVPGRPGLSAARLRAKEAHPLPMIEFLDLPEPGSFASARWPSPRLSDLGLALPRARLLPQRRSAARALAQRCARAHDDLASRLAELLSGVDEVVTHNPWGDYGHEDHILVSRVLSALRPRLGFKLWATGYASHRSLPLMQRLVPWLGPPSPPQPTDIPLAHRLRDHYTAAGAWTWRPGHAWPEDERFFPLRDAPDPEAPTEPALPITLVGGSWGLRHR